jgi:hypothetical protein
MAWVKARESAWMHLSSEELEDLLGFAWDDEMSQAVDA